MFAWQFMKMLASSTAHGWTRFVSMQNHYNLVYREEEREMLPLCREEGVGVIPWSPLARGFLAGNRRGVEPTQIALAWLLAQPGIAAPIVGASKLTHLDEAVAALDVQLAAEEMAFLQEPYRPHAVLGHT
jgi:aryl-alcohol dehydrogenase-like predicted oxidoreductase